MSHSNKNKLCQSSDHIVVSQKSCQKHLTPQQIISLVSKSLQHKEAILKQLDQLSIDTEKLQDLPLHRLYRYTEDAFRNTYSIKYLGLNNNEMGVISRRVDPLKPINEDIISSTSSGQNNSYTINKYFYPKPLKVGQKKPLQQSLNIYNLQNSIKTAFQHSKVAKNRERQSHKKRSNRTTVVGSWISKNKQSIHQQKIKAYHNTIENASKNEQQTSLKEQTKCNYSGIVLPFLNYAKAWYFPQTQKYQNN